MTLDDLIPLLPPTSLAALQFALTDALTAEQPDDAYSTLLALSERVRNAGYGLWGEDYVYLAGCVDDALSDLPCWIDNLAE